MSILENVVLWVGAKKYIVEQGISIYRYVKIKQN